MTKTVLAFAAVASMAFAGPALAQSVGAGTPSSGLRDFCANRPGKGTATCILDVGHWQVEAGLIDGAYQRDSATKVEAYGYGDVSFRYGLTSTTELNFGLTPWTTEKATDRMTGDSDTVDGVSDLTFGLRHSLANPDGSGLSVAIAGFVTAPTGSKDVRADGFEGGVIMPISMPLNDDWGFSVSPEIDVVSDSDGDGRHAAYTVAAGVGRGFGDWSLGAEIWISRDDDPVEAVTQSTFDLTAVWNPPMLADSQLDFGLNFGLNDDSPDVEFGLGLARRF